MRFHFEQTNYVNTYWKIYTIGDFETQLAYLEQCKYFISIKEKIESRSIAFQF